MIHVQLKLLATWTLDTCTLDSVISHTFNVTKEQQL